MPLRAMLAALSLVVLAPGAARAFSDDARFEEPAVAGGGGGRLFTGSPADGLTCAVCHGVSGETASLDVAGFPEDGYRPGQTYELEVTWPDGMLAAFALEVADGNGEPAGALALPEAAAIDATQRCASGDVDPPPPAVSLHPTADGRTVSVADACGAARGLLIWTAPDASTGPAFLYVAGVVADRSGTSEGDAVRTVARSAPAVGSPPAEVSVVDAGCAATRGASDGWWMMALAWLAFVGRRRRWARVGAAVALSLGVASSARAVPGPDSVTVLSNANVPESVALGEAYAAARDVPDRQVCAVDAPTDVTITLDDFRTRVVAGLETCLGDAIDRVEAVVVARGMPLRVEIPDGAGSRRVSLAAALGVWRSTIDGEPLLGQAPGVEAMCGGGATCYAARFINPYRNGAFGPGWTRTMGTIEWRPWLVTMLHARTYEDAAGLITSATEAEAAGGADGEIMLMNGADGARGVLDVEYDGVIAALMDRGFTSVTRVPFDANLTGHDLAAYFTGTASLGETIEGNTFRPGALVDNLTSFGAVPQNFEATGESQVSIARWVAMGVAGVHGTTDEPLNNVFPSRWLIVDYVDGATLAEAYHARMPYVYWHNLVLGDPMLAPYAVRPEVTIGGIADGETVDAPRIVDVHASDPEGFGIASVVLYAGGDEVARADGPDLSTCLTVPAGDDVQILAVAQKAGDDTDDRARHHPKGWLSLRVASSGAAGECAAPAPDGGVAPDGGARDAGPRADAGATPPGDDGGCGCAVPGGANARGFPVALLILALIAGRRLAR